MATLNINFKTSLIKYAEIFKKKFNVLTFKMLTLFVKLFKKQENTILNFLEKKGENIKYFLSSFKINKKISQKISIILIDTCLFFSNYKI